MHIAVLGNPGSWYCRDLRRACEERGHRFVHIDFPQLVARVGSAESPLQTEETDLASMDAVIVRTMPPGSLEQVVLRMDALATLEAAGVQVLNPPKAIECAVDKYLTTARLQAAGLPVPETVVCEHAEPAMEAFERLGRDVVVKPLFGGEGRGIVRVSDPDLAFRTFRTLERIQAVLYIQAYVEHDHDVRVLTLDGKVIGAIRRTRNDDFRTNVACNGSAERHVLSGREEERALRAAEAAGCRMAGVDLIGDCDAEGYVIEVNAVPGWRAFARATGCDVARRVMESVERGLQGLQKARPGDRTA